MTRTSNHPKKCQAIGGPDALATSLQNFGRAIGEALRAEAVVIPDDEPGDDPAARAAHIASHIRALVLRHVTSVPVNLQGEAALNVANDAADAAQRALLATLAPDTDLSWLPNGGRGIAERLERGGR